jgi:uroporphyrinogen decarboxylase
MNHYERFVNSILFEPVDRPARVDAFLLTEEVFGEHFFTAEEIAAAVPEDRPELIEQCARLHVQVASRYDYDAILVLHPFCGPANLEVIARIKALSVDEPRAIIGMVPGAFWAFETVSDHFEFASRLVEDMAGLHKDAQVMLEAAIKRVHELKKAGADVAYVPNDQAFNSGPYFSPAIYEQLVLPYAQKLFAEIRSLGMIGIYHSDGYIMELLDFIMKTGAHGLQSIDPMAGMDIKEVKERTYGKLSLLGNVQCNLLQEGPESAIRASARYCLQHASPGSGYVFMASNAIFQGLPLENYHIMQDEYDRFVSGNRHQ